jgi:hypothetical protein
MIIRIVVDLPEPFGPRKPVTTPATTSKLRFETALALPNRLVNEFTEITELIIKIQERRSYGATGHLPAGVNPTVATWLAERVKDYLAGAHVPFPPSWGSPNAEVLVPLRARRR